MIYNFNLGIGWASSGVEYAQLYRARIFRAIQEPAKFIFTDMFPRDNIEHLTKNIGFEDEEIIWLYTYFTDFRIAPVTFTLKDFRGMLADQEYSVKRNGKVGRIYFSGETDYCTVYFTDEKEDYVHRVEYVSDNLLIRKDYFTYGRVYSEYYAPLNGKAHMYLRRFFNTDGSVAYEEIEDDDEVMYRFPDQIFYSKEEFVGYFVRCLQLTEEDVVIIDRTTGVGQTILQNCGRARTGIVVHADHYSVGSTDEEYVLWNNFYEYSFNMYRHIDFFITATEVQRDLMKKQFGQYIGQVPEVAAIPVGSLAKLRRPEEERTPFSVVTASRLASEKHVDWIIEACVKAKKEIPQLSLDIYGAGGEFDALQQLIADRNAGEYVHLMGQQDLTDVYQNYELYLSGSTSEGFGLSLLEAIGGGLPIVGFDVPYGNPTFIDDGENGYLIPVDDHMSIPEHAEALAAQLIRFFTEADRQKFSEHSYEKAETYLTEKVMQRWKEILRR